MKREFECHWEKAHELVREEQLTEALRFFDLAIAAADATAGDKVTATKDKGVTLSRLGRLVEGNAIFDEVIERYKDDISPAERRAVNKSIYNKALNLEELDQAKDAISHFNMFLARNFRSSDPETERLVIVCLTNKANLLAKEDTGDETSHVEAMTSFDLIVKRFASSSEPDIAAKVIQALIYKTYAHVFKNRAIYWARSEEYRAAAFPIIDEAIVISTNHQDPDVLLQGARAIRMKAYLLGILGREEEKNACWSQPKLDSLFGSERGKVVGNLIEAEKTLQALADFAS